MRTRFGGRKRSFVLTKQLVNIFYAVSTYNTANQNSPSAFVSICNTFVKFFKNRLGTRSEFFSPIERSTLGGGRTICVHPIHAIFPNERIQTLRCFFHRFVKCF